MNLGNIEYYLGELVFDMEFNRLNIKILLFLLIYWVCRFKYDYYWEYKMICEEYIEGLLVFVEFREMLFIFVVSFFDLFVGVIVIVLFIIVVFC